MEAVQQEVGRCGVLLPDKLPSVQVFVGGPTVEPRPCRWAPGGLTRPPAGRSTSRIQRHDWFVTYTDVRPAGGRTTIFMLRPCHPPLVMSSNKSPQERL